jgi:hypothetical protein
MRRFLALALSATILHPGVSWAAPSAGPTIAQPGAPPIVAPRPEAPRPEGARPDAIHPEPPRGLEAPRADPELARANADMLAVYRATSTAVFGDAQTDLFESQRLWTRYADQMCQFAQDAAARSPRVERHETQSQCLTRAAVARQVELKSALITLGAWTFLHVIDHRVHPPHAGHGDGLIQEAITHLQLARPEAEAARRWNITVARALEQTVNTAYDLADGELPPTNDGRDIDLYAEVDLATVGPDLIDVNIRATADPAGPPAPRSSARSLIWSMKLGRAIQDTDLFDPREPWRPSLAQMAADRLDPGAPGGAAPALISAVAPFAADPSRWTLRPAGLQIDLRGAVNGPGPTTALVPWTLLSPYLRRPWFVDPSSLTEAAKG